MLFAFCHTTEVEPYMYRATRGDPMAFIFQMYVFVIGSY